MFKERFRNRSPRQLRARHLEVLGLGGVSRTIPHSAYSSPVAAEVADPGVVTGPFPVMVHYERLE